MRAWPTHALKITCLFLFFWSIGTSCVSAPKSASIVICGETGKVLQAKNADAITHPASLTKMMTLYLTFKALKEKKLKLTQKIPVSKFAAKQIPCKLWLKSGTTVSVRDAILGMITKSANDAATALGEFFGNGSETRFAQLMTDQARKLGMKNTIFKNASGVPNKQQVTTARDMATLSQALYKHFPEYFPLFKTQKFVHKGVVHGNHNKLLGQVKGLDGIKTGFVNASGFNLAASMVRDGKRIIAVVMGGESAKSRDKTMVKLLEATHSKMKKGNAFQKENDPESIEELIYTLGSSGAYEEKKAGKVMKAAYAPKKDVYDTLDDLLKEINKAPIAQKKSLQTTVKKADTSKKKPIPKKTSKNSVKKIKKKKS